MATRDGGSIDDLLAALPVDQIAGSLGIDPAEAQKAATAALPALFGGLQANAQDPAGAASLQKALSRHSPALVEGGIAVDDVDTHDGRKIVGNVFGDNTDQVVAKLSETSGTRPSVLQQLLPVLAPIALSYLAKQAGRGGGPAMPKQTPNWSPGPTDEQLAGGGLGDLLGSILGGRAAGGAGGPGGLDIGSVLGGLGGLLGGGKR